MEAVEQKYSINKQMLGFGLTEFGKNLFDFLVQTYLLLYLTTVAKLPLAAVGTMFLVVKIVAIFTDGFAGIVLDQTHTKLGRSRPWLLASAIVLVVGSALVFSAPQLSQGGKIVYMYVGYLFYSLGYSFLNIPQDAIQVTLTEDSYERTKIASSKYFFDVIGNLFFANGFVMLLTYLNKVGLTEISAYFKTAVIAASIAALTIIVGVFLLKEVYLTEPDKNESGINVAQSLKSLITDKYAIIVICYSFSMLLITMGVNSNVAFFFQYVYGNSSLVGIGISVINLVGIVIPFVIPILNKKVSKTTISKIGCVLAVIGLGTLFLGRFDHVIPFIGLGIYGLGFGMIGTIFVALHPEVFDNLELKTGHPVAGFSAAFFSYGAQIGGGISGVLTTRILSASGFNSAVQTQSGSANLGIMGAMVGVPLIAVVIIFVLMSIYDLDRRYPEVKAKLTLMRQGK